MGEATNRVQGIINAAAPNPNLMAKAQQIYNVSAQLAKERQFYAQITNPFTGKPITSIQDLNALIKQFDTDINYNFQALLPNGAIERRLSEKYNLSLNLKNKFNENEATRVKERLNTLAQDALSIMTSNMGDFADKTDQWVLQQVVYAMGALNVSNGIFTIFTTDRSINRINMGAYDLFGVEKLPKNLDVVNISANIAGSGRTRQRGVLIRDSITNIPISIDINPDFNDFSERAFEKLYQWAEKEHLLDTREAVSNKMGTGTLSPMSVSPQEFESDVFTAVSDLLGGTYKGLLTSTNGDFHELYTKYNIASEIALGRQLSNVRGFLGELRAILIIDAMFPNGNGHLMGTAKVQLANATKGGESAPVDLLVDLFKELGLQFGFQVKNTSELNSYSWGNRRSRGGMAIPTFYTERLQSSLSAAEQEFFGAYAYNQPIDDNWYATNVYPGFEGKFPEFYAVYSKLALYIIRQETEISSSNNPLLSGTLTNDFFIMNDKIIPASSLYQAMNDENDNLVNSYFNIWTNSTGYYTPQTPIPNNYMSYATQTMVTYDISVKYAMLLQSAYNMS